MRRIKLGGLVGWLLHPSQQLSKRALHATIWTFGAQGFERLLGYARIIVLARLLAPGDFGLMGIAMMAVVTMEALTKPGLFEALIHKKGEIDEYLDTVWTLSIIRGVFVAGALVLLAPLVAAFFDAPDARTMVQVVGAGHLIWSFQNPGVIYLEKNLEYQKLSLLWLFVTVIEVAVSVTAAVMLRSAWALVLGFLARNIVHLLVSYWIHPYRPRLHLQKNQGKELFTFGRWVYVDRLLGFVTGQSDRFVLAKLLGASPLGVYQMARNTTVLPMREINSAFSRVAFPVYSKLQDDLAKLQRAYLIATEATSSLLLPMAVAIYLLARDFVVLVLGEKWLAAAEVIPVLIIGAALNSLASAAGPLFMGAGRPELNFRINLFKAIAVAAVVFPLTKIFGLTGAAYTLVVAGSVGFAFYFYFVLSVLHLQVGELVKAFLPAIALSTAVALVILVSKQLIGLPSLPLFVSTISLIICTYLGIQAILGWKFNAGFIHVLAATRR